MSIKIINLCFFSCCKTKGGEVISAVKLELTLRPNLSKLGLPEMLKIYWRKSEQFQRVENTIIKAILQNKYKVRVLNIFVLIS